LQYIQPQDAHVLGQAELVIIDEAAAIPLPLVRQLIGPYLVFMASTINGYEGTGRSLSIKLIQQLRESTRASSAAASLTAKEDAAKPAEGDKKKPEGNSKATVGRSLREIKLDEPIRYGSGDPVERWLNTLLCLDASLVSRNVSGCPHPSQCSLYHVSRDTLFSFHPASELFLQRMMALYVSSHYKNSPNDLQLMSDAPAHELFVLLPPIAADDNTLPEPLVVLQVAMEGRISKDVILEALARGERAGGDLIPWLMAQQFQDDDFAMLSGARVVRIATHPDYANMGYGARALAELDAFYSGELSNLDDLPERNPDEEQATIVDDDIAADDALHSEAIAVRAPQAMPPLLQRLSERRPPVLDYIGVSYGLTPQLLRFWKRSGFVPLYLRQTANDLTGEHSCVMLKALGGVEKEEEGWLEAFATGTCFDDLPSTVPDCIR
jgi:N-acetyltransferase 10